MSKAIRNGIIKLIVFLAILALIICWVNAVFAPKNNTKAAGMGYEKARGYLAEKENTIDVVFLGDSLTYSAISPMIFWRNNGFSSYVAATGGQKLCEGTRFLRSVIQTQKPKLVVIEANAIYRKSTNENYFGSIAKEILPLIENHDRWKSLRLEDFYEPVNYTNITKFKGYSYFSAVKPVVDGLENTYMQESDEVTSISDVNLRSLNDIKEICDSIGARLLIISTPSVKCWNYMRYNGVKNYVEGKDIDYLDLNLHPEYANINWQTDTRDLGDHLNYSGAKKVSEFLTGYLSETYNLPDHRNDEAYYESWEKSCQYYEDAIIRTQKKEKEKAEKKAKEEAEQKAKEEEEKKAREEEEKAQKKAEDKDKEKREH